MASSSDAELCRCLAQATGCGIWTWDLVTGALAMDARCDELVGDRRLRTLILRDAAAAPGDFQYDRCVSGDARPRRWLRLSGRALTDAEGHVVRCVGVMRDVTDEHTVRESEDRLRFVVGGAHDGVWELEARTGRVWWSEELLATLGLAPGAGPRNVDEALAFLHPDDRGIADAVVAKARAHGRARICPTVRLRHSSGDWRHVDGWTVAEADPGTGKLRRIAGIVQDRTDAPHPDTRTIASTLSRAVLEPIELADRHVKLAALAQALAPERAGAEINASSAQLARARDAVEELILAELLVAAGD